MSPERDVMHRRFRLWRRACLFLVVSTLVSIGMAVAEDGSFSGGFRIGTGGYGGVYYPLGSAICRLYNRDHAGDPCAAVVSEGSVANLRALSADAQDIALVQSDIERQAVDGLGAFTGGAAVPDLRVLFVAHAEAFTVLVTADAEIAAVDDLPGRRIAAGSEGSGSLATTRALMAAAGWSDATFATLALLSPDDQAAALCSGGVDVMLFQVGHPNGYVQDAALHCGARLVPMTGPLVDALIRTSPSFRAVAIPGGIYTNHPRPTPTVGSLAEAVTRAGQSEARIARLLAAIFDNLDTLRRLHPALADLNREEMVPRTSAVPIHPAAEAFYRARGWLP